MSHADFSPSSAHRWIACPRSVELSRGKVSTATFYSAEGTLAHRLGEQGLTTGEDVSALLGNITLVDGHEVTVTEEMIDAVQLYLNTVVNYPTGPNVFRYVEKKVHLNGAVWGTADCILYDAWDEALTVIDLKYGKGIAVDADDNEQLMIYGLAAARTLGVSPKTVTCVIVQPRVANAIRKASFAFLDLLLWEDLVLAPALLAASDPFTPLKVGPHCRFCPARPDCPALRDEVLKTAQLDFADTPPPPGTLTSEALGKVLDKAELIASWVAAVRAEASARIDHGELVPGWKLVPKRAMRRWSDAQATATLLKQAGLGDADLYDYELRTVAQIEKLVDNILGKGAFKTQFQPTLVTQESTGSTLVPTDDPRPPIAAGPKTEFEEV